MLNLEVGRKRKLRGGARDEKQLISLLLAQEHPCVWRPRGYSLLLNSHDDLNSVKAVESEGAGEGSVGVDLAARSGGARRERQQYVSHQSERPHDRPTAGPARRSIIAWANCLLRPRRVPAITLSPSHSVRLTFAGSTFSKLFKISTILF